MPPPNQPTPPAPTPAPGSPGDPTLRALAQKSKLSPALTQILVETGKMSFEPAPKKTTVAAAIQANPALQDHIGHLPPNMEVCIGQKKSS